MPSKIEIREATFAYDAPDAVPLMRRVSLTVNRGDVVIIGGKSGHGTSTLLELMVGLLRPKAGAVLWDDRNIAGVRSETLMQLRRSIGFVFQEGALISNFTAYDNIALPLRTRGGMVEEELRTRVRSLMEEFGLFNVEAKYPEALSEWQTKAVAAARALAGDPDMLLLDEPVSGLDPVTAGGILNAVERRWKTTGLAVVMISHDLSMWPHIAANRLSLESGKLYPYREGACHEGPMEQRA